MKGWLTILVVPVVAALPLLGQAPSTGVVPAAGAAPTASAQEPAATAAAAKPTTTTPAASAPAPSHTEPKNSSAAVTPEAEPPAPDTSRRPENNRRPREDFLTEIVGPDDAPLDADDAAALELVKRWQGAKDQPTITDSGQVIFTYGAAMPHIICALLHETDIALAEGETILPEGVHLGDTVRWEVKPAISGPRNAQVTHVVIKPKAVNAETNLVIATDRRVYNIALRSTRDQYMPLVAFSYPEDIRARWAAYAQRQREKQIQNTIPETGEDISKLDFDYEIEGKAPWKPLRVYNNGVKTVIQMPAKMKNAEAPSLLVINDENNQQVVNFRLRGDRYIVDNLFQKAVLTLGVGRHQEKVTITRLGK